MEGMLIFAMLIAAIFLGCMFGYMTDTTIEYAPFIGGIIGFIIGVIILAIFVPMLYI